MTAPAFTAQLLTLFPEMFPGPLGFSLAGRGLERGLWALKTLDIRDFSSDKHRSVDDTPAGGGAGMVLRADVCARAVDAARTESEAAWPLVYPSPRGVPFTQALAADWLAAGGVTLFCGRFEGVDERLLEARPFVEVSLGDFVLSGGEPAALAMLDSVVRLIPGIVGAPATLAEESFTGGLLEYPHYTRPARWEGRDIPAVLSSGDHGAVAAWRQAQSEEVTRIRRPDLWSTYVRAREQKDRSNECD